MENTMDKEQTKGFIKVLQQLTGETRFDTDQLLPMIEQMQLMGVLIEDFNATEDEEELLLIGARMKSCEAESRRVARDFFKGYGISLEDMQEKASNPEFMKDLDQSVFKKAQEKMMRIDQKLAEQNKNVSKKTKKKRKNKGKGRKRV